MALLTFYKDDQELIKYTLKQETTTVGRSAAADICLPDTNISRTHFVISLSDGKFFIIDKSTNGTFVKDVAVVSSELKDGDRISIGDWAIIFSVDSDFETKQTTQIVGRDPTEILSYSSDNNELAYKRAYIDFVDAKKKPYALKKELISIGKAESNDIRIQNDKFVSNFHCKLEYRKSAFFLKDLKSTNGTFVNNQQVIEAAIPDGATFTVGKTNLRLLFKEEREKLKPFSGNEFHGMVGQTVAMRQLFSLISRVASSDAIVLIHGETGVGKELVAKAIHELSGRVNKKLVTLNCSAIAKDLIESELFGHEKGAFTSAHQQRKGAFEAANLSTLFLDEIGDMPLDLQPKLLRALENREVKRVGSNALVDVDARVVAATNQNLVDLVKKGKFREDLYYRLYVVPVVIPPLRERVEDIPLLADYFLQAARGKRKKPKGLSNAALEALMAFEWPGNVRELKNLISRAVLSATGEYIEVNDLNFAPKTLKEQTHFEQRGTRIGDDPPPKTLRDFEKEKILQELNRHKWNKTKTAEVLGIAKTTLFEKIKKYQLKP